jgi:hypothetical protein
MTVQPVGDDTSPTSASPHRAPWPTGVERAPTALLLAGPPA